MNVCIMPRPRGVIYNNNENLILNKETKYIFSELKNEEG